jgi:lipopolysaccharide/colanic/teichoic acid biosynthesis glycosyltransferase
MVMVAVAIRRSSVGPILFRQRRIGRHGKPFEIYKFRTMVVGAEFSGSVTTQNDPRVGRVGKWIRAKKLDELPQLVNVLNGSMSLVGPRPMVISDFERLDDRQRRRVSVRPGLTGLAQVSGNTALSWPRRIEFDLEYVDRRSVAMDCRILGKTAAMVLNGSAATESPSADEWSEATPNVAWQQSTRST